MNQSHKYFYYDGQQKIGPLTIEELLYHPIQRTTLVWHSGMSDWRQAHLLPELNHLWENQPPPINDIYSKHSCKKTTNSWLIVNIIATIVVCLPLGIIGIIFSCVSEQNRNAGRLQEAERNANIAAIIGKVNIALMIVYALAVLILALSTITGSFFLFDFLNHFVDHVHNFH